MNVRGEQVLMVSAAALSLVLGQLHGGVGGAEPGEREATDEDEVRGAED